jgi:Tfp pilus assembly protein FimT
MSPASLPDFRSNARRPKETFRTPAFTLIEMIVVVSIIVLMSLLLVPAFNLVRGGTDFTSSLYNVSEFLDQARAFAMANNTYVYVGFQEVDVSQSPGAVPQSAYTSGGAGGRIGLYAIASSNGVSSLPSSGTSGFLSITKLRRFDNVHLASVNLGGGGSISASAVPGIVLSGTNLYNTTAMATPLFTYPVGNNSVLTPSVTSTPQYSFGNQSLQFDPQGVPRVITSGTVGNLMQYIAIGFQQTHGNIVPATEPAMEAAIQIDGMSGVNRIFRR